jgi:hypothetical protein
MLYRFREAQAAELGLGTRADRRPKMASACKSLRECERWRGEILREISRKVSKIQDGTFLVMVCRWYVSSKTLVSCLFPRRWHSVICFGVVVLDLWWDSWSLGL